MAGPRIIVVGGGLAGLAAVIKIAEKGGNVDLFSIVPVKRSHSVCAQGGINAAKNLKGEGDTTDKHFDDTIYGGDFLANQTPVKAMCEAAPGTIDLLDRMGVPFNRTPEGLLDFRRFGGTLYPRGTVHSLAPPPANSFSTRSTSRSVDTNPKGKVKKYEGWEFLSRGPRLQGHRSRHHLAQSPHHGAAFLPCRRHHPRHRRRRRHLRQEHQLCRLHRISAVVAIFQQGAYYANGEFIQVHPTAIPGEDKLRLMSESARGEGGRVWVPRTPGDKRPIKQIPESDRFYFLEEWYPKYGNLVPRDIATRAIHKIVYEHHLGIDGQPMVYLDLTHIDRETLNRKLEGILEIYEKFVGDDPREVPMKIFPGMHYTMGGLWVDFSQMTNIPGIFAAGECEYQYHGANRLGANSLVSCIFGGFVSGPNALAYAKSLPAAEGDGGHSAEIARQTAINNKLLKNEGTENPFKLWRELGDTMSKHATVVRYNKGLQEADQKIVDLIDRFKKVNLSDKSQWANTSFAFARQLSNGAQTFAGRCPRGDPARRVARRTLQARLPRSQR